MNISIILLRLLLACAGGAIGGLLVSGILALIDHFHPSPPPISDPKTLQTMQQNAEFIYEMSKTHKQAKKERESE